MTYQPIPKWVSSTTWGTDTVTCWLREDKPEGWKATLDAVMASRGYYPTAYHAPPTTKHTKKMFQCMPSLATDDGRGKWAEWLDYYQSVYGITLDKPFAPGYMSSKPWQIWEDYWYGDRAPKLAEAGEWLVEKYGD